MHTEPTYSQIEAACRAVGSDLSAHRRERMKAALIAAQQVDRNIYGDMHVGFSCDGVTLQTNSVESRDRIVRWHHLAETTIPYHEKHTIPELIRLRAELAAIREGQRIGQEAVADLERRRLESQARRLENQ